MTPGSRRSQRSTRRSRSTRVRRHQSFPNSANRSDSSNPCENQRRPPTLTLSVGGRHLNVREPAAYAFLSVHAVQFGLFVSCCDGTSVTSVPYEPPLKYAPVGN